MENYIFIGQVVSIWGKIYISSVVNFMIYRRIYVM